jgi:hypothetical protein
LAFTPMIMPFTFSSRIILISHRLNLTLFIIPFIVPELCPLVHWKNVKLMIFNCQNLEIIKRKKKVSTTMHSSCLIMTVISCMVLELCPLINWNITICVVWVLLL